MIIMLAETLMLIGRDNPKYAEQLFIQSGGVINETKSGVKYIIIKEDVIN
jgi:hypothetical protein